jgi:Deoxycytidylate deaminase
MRLAEKLVPGITLGILKRAVKEAMFSDYELSIGAVIFKGKRIISSGHNNLRHCRIHPKYQDYPNSLHAEQDALLGMDWNNVKGCSILVVRVNPSGFFAESRPCEKCYNLLNFVGIKKVYYSDKFGNIISCALQDMEIKSFRIRETRRGVKFPIDNV